MIEEPMYRARCVIASMGSVAPIVKASIAEGCYTPTWAIESLPRWVKVELAIILYERSHFVADVPEIDDRVERALWNVAHEKQLFGENLGKWKEQLERIGA